MSMPRGIPPRSPEPGHAIVPPATRRMMAEVAPAAQEVDWRRYVSSVKRFKWLGLGVTLGGPAAGGVATRLLPPNLPAYQTEGGLWIDPTAPRPQRARPHTP